jgi:hypothetical protein
MADIKARDYPEVYEDLGIDTGRLGCIMLDTEPIPVSHILQYDDLYYADPEIHKYIQGIVSESVPHITLLYGLMRSGLELKKHVDRVLAGWEPASLIIDRVDFFYSNEPGENYVALIALMQVTDNLKEANARLGLLPHLNTFADYKPHITLAYIKDTADVEGYVARLNQELAAGQGVQPVAINYGG